MTSEKPKPSFSHLIPFGRLAALRGRLVAGPAGVDFHKVRLALLEPRLDHAGVGAHRLVEAGHRLGPAVGAVLENGELQPGVGV